MNCPYGFNRPFGRRSRETHDGSPLRSGIFRMNIQIEFIGFPLIYDLFPEGLHPFSFSGNRLMQLVEDLIARRGARVKESLSDPGKNSLDPAIQIMINKKLILKNKISEQRIEEGDQITFMKLLAGG
jgi:hypothetical protein